MKAVVVFSTSHCGCSLNLHVVKQLTGLQTVDWPAVTVWSVLPCQAAAALKELYKKHPTLYNSSMVCSFEPKVIYRVRGCRDWVRRPVIDGQSSVGEREQNGLVLFFSLVYLMVSWSRTFQALRMMLYYEQLTWFHLLCSTPDETERPRRGHGADPSSVEPE